VGDQLDPLVVHVRNASRDVFRQGRPFQVRLDGHESSVQFGEFVEVLAVLGLVKVPHLGAWCNTPLPAGVLYNARVGPDKVGATVILASDGDVPHLAVITQVVIRGLPRV